MLGSSALTIWQTKICCMALLHALGRICKFFLRCKNLYRIGPRPHVYYQKTQFYSKLARQWGHHQRRHQFRQGTFGEEHLFGRDEVDKGTALVPSHVQIEDQSLLTTDRSSNCFGHHQRSLLCQKEYYNTHLTRWSAVILYIILLLPPQPKLACLTFWGAREAIRASFG